MTEIIDGKIVHNELTVNARGGTELMAERVVKHVNPLALQDVQIISSRVREVDDTKYLVYHAHDLAQDNECRVLERGHPFRVQLDKIVFVSWWQAEQFIKRFDILPNEYTVIPNMIEPFSFYDAQYKCKNMSDPTVNLVYHTTPHRGLDVLVSVFEKIAAADPNVHLHVFSSFKAYGWNDSDKHYEPIFDACRKHPQITYHGFQPNDVVRKHLIDTADIFAYPSTWLETSCLALIEALAAGCHAVHSYYGALPETARGFTDMVDGSTEFLINYKFTLEKKIAKVRKARRCLSAQVQTFNSLHSVDNVKHLWNDLLGDIKGEDYSQ